MYVTLKISVNHKGETKLILAADQSFQVSRSEWRPGADKRSQQRRKDDYASLVGVHPAIRKRGLRLILQIPSVISGKRIFNLEQKEGISSNALRATKRSFVEAIMATGKPHL